MDTSGPRKRRRHAAINAARLPSVDPGAGADTVMTAYTAWIAQLYTDLSESIDGIALQGSTPVEFGTNAAGIALSRMLSHSAGILRGWSIRETAAQAVTIDFYDVDEAQNSLVVAGEWRKVATTSLAASGKETLEVPDVSFVGGLGVVFTGTGVVTGAVFINGVD